MVDYFQDFLNTYLDFKELVDQNLFSQPQFLLSHVLYKETFQNQLSFLIIISTFKILLI